MPPGDRDLQDNTKALHENTRQLKQQEKVLKAINDNLVAVGRKYLEESNGKPPNS